jgi:hypothetical protein
MFVGGEWDPWGAGYPEIPVDADTRVYSAPHGSHWSASIFALKTDEKNEALATLKQWGGVTTHRTLRAPRQPIVYVPSRKLVGD